MARLREVLASETSLTGLSTFIASGNIICDDPADAAASCATVREVISKEFGVDTPVIHRTHAQLVASEAAQPFTDASDKLVHAMFLVGAPVGGSVEALEHRLLPGEHLALIGRDLWIEFSEAGVHSTKLTKAVLDKALGTAGTARNLRTTRTLIELTAEA